MSADKTGTDTDSAKVQRTAWHIFFSFLLSERAPEGSEVRPELQLGSELPIADYILLLLESVRPETAGVLRGLWKHLPRAVVVEFKSIARTLREGDIDQLIAYGALYRRMFVKDLPLPTDLGLLLLLPTRTARFDAEIAAFRWELQDLGGGYWTVVRSDYPVFVAFLDEVARTETDSVLATFAGAATWDQTSYDWWYQHAGAGGAVRMGNREVRVEELPGYEDIAGHLLASFSFEKRLQGIPTQERLQGIPVEERLTGIHGFESLLALPDEVLRTLPESYLEVLPANVRDRLAARLGWTPQ